MALLTEQKQAIIHRAVTQGLDPSVPMKESGIPWLGEIPAHWEVVRLGRIVRSANAGEVISKNWWGIGNETLYTCARNSLRSNFAPFPAWKRTSGLDLLLTRNGTPYVHKPVSNAIYSNVVQRINLTQNINRDYIAIALGISASFMKGYGVSIESLNYSMWKALPIPLATLPEQAVLLQAIGARTGPLDVTIERTQRQIGLLREYRARLVADVVTGKLDVRAFAETLPDEAPDDIEAIEADVDEDADDDETGDGADEG